MDINIFSLKGFQVQFLMEKKSWKIHMALQNLRALQGEKMKER